MTSIRWCLALFLLGPIVVAQADQVEMLNGDRYVGGVLSMSADTVFVQSDVLGQIKIPRNKVSTITLGVAVNHVTASAGSSPAAAVADPTGPLAQLTAHTNLVEGIRKQFLAEAGPEANGKFDDLLSGLMSGKIDMNGLRAQAKSAADQLRSMKKDSGGDAMLDAYLGILDKFLAEEPAPDPAAPAVPVVTNNPHGTTIIR